MMAEQPIDPATEQLPAQQQNPLAEAPQDAARAALVQELTEWAKAERKFWKPVHDRMRDEQRFAAGDQWRSGYRTKTDEEEPYIGDIVQQLVNRVVASLYAKNPTPDAKRLEKLLFEKWDGSQESLRGAQALVAQVMQTQPMLDENGQPIIPPEAAMAAEIVSDYERGMAEKQMMEKIAETAQLLIKHRWKTHKPDFKVLMKQAVTQAVVSRVAFIQVDYQRTIEPSQNQDAGVTQADKLASLRQKLQALAQSDEKDSAPVKEELRLMLEALNRQNDGGKVTFEGTVYQLVPATSVIVDRNCTCLWEFLGARRIARQTLMECAAVEKRYGISLKDAGAVMYGAAGEVESETTVKPEAGDQPKSGESGKAKPKVCVWHVYDKDTQLCYVVCDGVKDFLEEPACPEPAVERFWPIVPLTLNAQVVEVNEPEHDVTIYPRSHVRLQMPMQEDINAAGEGLREHRVANRPRWAALKQRWQEGDLAKLAAPAVAHDTLLVESIAPGEKVGDFLQRLPTAEIDPRMYDAAPSLQAAMLATGLQPANLGAQAGGEKATGQAIAEGARISADQSNVDGVDFALSVLGQMTWEMEIQETSEQTVKRICGVGAMWSTLSRREVQEEIYLEVEAGSSGRPNQALDAQKFKEIAPLAVPWLQQAGVPLDVLIKEAFRILGIKLDIDDLLRKAQAMGGGQMPAGMPPNAGAVGPGTIPPGQAAPNVAPNGVPGAPPIPPQQRQQVAASAMSVR